MKHISEILETIFVGLEVQHEAHPCTIDAIRKEKACLIEDIFRVMKASCQMNSIYIDLIGAKAVKSFDELYEMSIYDLELLLSHLSAELKIWMCNNQRLSMSLNHRRNRFRDKFIDDENYGTGLPYPFD